MENIIEKLMQIEEQAQQATRLVEAERENLPRRIRESVDELRAKAETDTARAVKAIEKQYEAETEKRIAEIKTAHTARSQALEALYAHEAKAWASDILRGITGR